MKRLAVIPARSGSKGLVDKNIMLLCGKPLMAYSIEVALKTCLFDEVMVSTDSVRYSDIAKEYGASVPFLRSINNSNDKASSWDVVREILNEYKKLGLTYDLVMLLQPTSPLRNNEDIINTFKIMDKSKSNAVVSVTQADHSPLWYNTLPLDLSLKEFINKEFIDKPRQDLSTYYRINGSIYCFKVDYFLKTKSIYEDGCLAYIMPKERSIDIDDRYDFICAEALMKSIK